MDYFLFHFEYVFYGAWLVIYAVRYYMNGVIYKQQGYENSEHKRSGDVDRVDYMAALTLYWEPEEEDIPKRTRQKKWANTGNLAFVLYTLFCIFIWVYTYHLNQVYTLEKDPLYFFH